MATFFNLTLDTQAPDVTWGTPIGGAPGQLLTIPYTINEPEIISAKIYDSQGRNFDLTVGATELTGIMPADQYAGPAEIRAVVRDEVHNQGIEYLALVLSGQVAGTEQQGGGVSREFTQIGGPAFVLQSDRFDGEVSGATRDVIRISGIISPRRTPPAEIQRVRGLVRAALSDRSSFTGVREGNVTLAQIRREDEEILALIH